MRKNKLNEYDKKKMEKLEKKMRQEKKLNDKLIKGMKHKFIKYGEDI
jgi:hypothetical protein